MRKHEPILAAALVGAALVLAACGTETPSAGGGGTPGSTETSSGSPSRTTSTPTRVASTAPSQTPSGAPVQTPSDAPSQKPARSHSHSSGGSRATGRCHTSELAATVRMRDSAAGHRHAWLVLTNTSPRTCTIYGYGGMQLYRSNGAAVPTRMVRDPSVPPRLRTLPPGGSVRSSLSWSVVPAGGEPTTTACEPMGTTAHVTPPDETSYDSIPWHFGEVCDRGTIDQGAYR